jgi:hypothetical protein
MWLTPRLGRACSCYRQWRICERKEAACLVGLLNLSLVTVIGILLPESPRAPTVINPKRYRW